MTVKKIEHQLPMLMEKHTDEVKLAVVFPANRDLSVR